MSITDQTPETEETPKIAPVETQTTPEKGAKPKRKPLSPLWSWHIKLVVGVLLLAGVIALTIRFKNYLQLFITAWLISFLVRPLVRWISKHTKMKWKLASAIVYVLLLALLIWGVVSGGRGLVGQITDLFKSLQDNVGMFTDFLEGLSNKTVTLIGPIKFTTPDINIDFLTEKVNEFIQPVVTEITRTAPKLLSSVGNFVFNMVITILVSFFISSESAGEKRPIFDLKNQEYAYDLRRMGNEITGNFNAFLRGTFTVVVIAIVVYSILLGAFGMPYFLLFALIAGFGRFVPYLGAFIGWVGVGVGALIQRPTPFGLTPFVYALVILGICLFIDLILDHIITPSVMSEALEVHPAAILISALIGGQLFGLMGVILAAPAFAVLVLLVRYAVRKIFDEDPWEGMIYYRKPKEPGILKALRKFFERIWQWTEKPRHAIRDWAVRLWAKIAAFFKRLTDKLPKRKRRRAKDKPSAGGGDGSPYPDDKHGTEGNADSE